MPELPVGARAVLLSRAGACILKEAGGELLDPAGGPWDVMSRRVLAANGQLGPGVARLLAGCSSSPEEPPVPSGVAQQQQQGTGGS